MAPNTGCLTAAALFLAANALRTVYIVRYFGRPHSSWEELLNVSTDYIKSEIDWNTDSTNRLIFRLSSMTNMFAWLFLCAPLVQVAWCQSRGGKRQVGVHVGIAVFAVIGTFGEVMSRLLIFGFEGTSHWIGSTFELANWLPQEISSGVEDNVGYSVYSIVELALRAMQTWVDSFEWICFTVIFFLLFFSITTQEDSRKVLPNWLAYIGLMIGLLSIMDFGSDILIYEDAQTFGYAALVTNILSTWVLLPIFLIALAFYFPGLAPDRISFIPSSGDDRTIELSTTPTAAATNGGEPGTPSRAPPAQMFAASPTAGGVAAPMTTGGGADDNTDDNPGLL